MNCWPRCPPPRTPHHRLAPAALAAWPPHLRRDQPLRLCPRRAAPPAGSLPRHLLQRARAPPARPARVHRLRYDPRAASRSGSGARSHPPPQTTRGAAGRPAAVHFPATRATIWSGCSGFPPSKTTVTPLAGSLRATPRAERPIPQPYLLYVGDRAGYKNADLLAAHLGRATRTAAPQFQLVFFGGSTLHRGRTSADHRARPGRPDPPGDRHGQDLATWYAHAFALVYPSLYEGFGIPPLEAMQYGCPVLASDRSSLPEVVGEAGRLFHPDAESSLADALRELVEHPAERADLVRKGHQHHRKVHVERMRRPDPGRLCVPDATARPS
jgi:glycosyltransferase involved in cell wall biosynthesis